MLKSKLIGRLLGKEWLIKKSFREKNAAKYLVENINTGEEISIYSNTVSRCLKKPESFNPEALKELREKKNFRKRERNQIKYSVLDFTPRPRFIDAKQEVEYCMKKIRQVRKCEECLRFKESCKTLAKLLEEQKND